MKVLVDTCVWSKALRHKKPDLIIASQLKDLISDGRAAIIGPIRQEVLAGISEDKQFNSLKSKLSAFEDIPLKSEYFIYAAELSNTCRKKGVQGASTDFLICAIALKLKMLIFTSDNDFKQYQNHLDIKLFE